jgi:hypothetical protein
MSLRNQITSNFPDIAVTDANGNITGLLVENITSYGDTILGDPSTIFITGGTTGAVLSKSSGNSLTWGLPALNQLNSFSSTARTTGAIASPGDTTVTVQGPIPSQLVVNNYIAFSAVPTLS